MELKDISLKYAKFLADEKIDRLKQELKQPNIFSILRVTHYEIRHSNFLAWLLNPSESHGLGSLFLERTLRDLSLIESIDTFSIFEIPKLIEGTIGVYRELNNIDLLIQLPDLIITIENKIYSGENGDQLITYRNIIKENFPNHKQLFVYLTLSGGDSSLPEVYHNYSYERIVENLEAIIRVNNKTLSAISKCYISDYIHNLKLYVMGTSEANKLSREIYFSHKDFFDFIFENKPDPVDEFKKYLETKIKSLGYILGSPGKGFVRFLSPELNNIIPKNKGSRGWTYKESFLFEINILYGQKLRIYCTISPGDEKSRGILKPALNNAFNIEPFGNHWFCYYNKSIDYNLVASGEEAIQDFLNQISEYVKEMVSKSAAVITPLKKQLLEIIQNGESN